MASSNKYANGKIYKVVDNAYATCYYGSTVEVLSRRMAGHRAQYKLFGEGKRDRISVFDIFDAHGVDQCKIELVEEFPCESSEQLHKREGFYIQNNECVNKRVAGRTFAEWRDATRERTNEVARRWRSANLEKAKEAEKKYKDKNREKNWEFKSAKCVCNVCGAEHTHGVAAQHRRTKKHLDAEALLHADAYEKN